MIYCVPGFKWLGVTLACNFSFNFPLEGHVTDEKFGVRPKIKFSVASPAKRSFAISTSIKTVSYHSSILQTITTMLIGNPFVVVISLDLSKAFDTVRHATVADKMSMLSIPDNVYNWVVRYFTEHEHCTVYELEVSTFQKVNAMACYPRLEHWPFKLWCGRIWSTSSGWEEQVYLITRWTRSHDRKF